MKNIKIKYLTNADKLKVLFADYFFIVFVAFIVDGILESNFGNDWLNPWLFRILIYLLVIFLPELYLNKTLGMKFFGVIIEGKKKGRISFQFAKYSILIFLDRYLFILVYIFRVLLYSNASLLLSEKYSGLRWEKKIYQFKS